MALTSRSEVSWRIEKLRWERKLGTNRYVGVGFVERSDVLELEHIALYEGLADLLVGPRDEHLVVAVGLLGHADGEVNGGLDIHTLPVRFEEDAQLLGSTQGEDGDQHFTATIHTIVHFF